MRRFYSLIVFVAVLFAGCGRDAGHTEQLYLCNELEEKVTLTLFRDGEVFEYVVGSDSVERHKPDAEPTLKTLRELDVEPAEAIVVGDMPVDVLMARNATVRSVGVTWGNASREELVEADADYIIDSIEELLPIVL